MRCSVHPKVLAVVLALVPVVFSQTVPQGVQKVTAMEGISEYALPNGLHVLLFPESSKPKVTMNMTYLVGSRHEGYGETGMAHLLEHMLFKQTKSGRDIKKDLTNHGATSNGTTSSDRTNYFETVTASDDNLKWALDLEADRMVNVRIEKAILDTEMTVVLNELELRESNPFGILFQRTLEAAYTVHNYRKSTLGNRSDIEHVPIEKLAAFYQKFYQPDNAVLTITGQFDPAKALSLALSTVGTVARPSRILDKSYTTEPTQDGERSVTLHRVGGIQCLIAVYHTPAITHPDSAPLDVLAIILGDNPSGRLYKALVKNEHAVGVGVEQKDRHDPGFFLASVTLRKGQSLDEARQVLLKEIESFAETPPSNEDLERAKSRILKQYDLGLTNSEMIGLVMSECIADGDWRLLFYTRDEIKKVTVQDVMRVSKAYLKESNRTLGQFMPTETPDRAEIPAAPDAAVVLKDFKGGAAISEGEAFTPTPANIEKRLIRSQHQNGMKLILLPKLTRGGIVTARVSLHFGTEKSLYGQSALGQLAGDLLMRGTKDKSRQQIQDEMDRWHARIDLSGSATGATASLETTEQNFTGALRLVAELLRESSFPKDELEQVRQQRIAGIENGKGDPLALGNIEIQRHMHPYTRGDVRYVGRPEEEIEDLTKVTLDGVRRFYRQFYGTSDAECAIVGQFDPSEARKLVADLFDNWKSPSRYERVPTLYHKVESMDRKIETPDKQNAVFLAGLTDRMSDDDADYPAMILANYMLGGSGASRLQKRIREKEGLSYSVDSRFYAPSKDDGATFTSMAISSPQNAPKLETSYKDELARALKDGFTTEEVTAAKKSWLAERMVSRSRDQALMATLASRERFGRTIKWDEVLEAKIAALTPEQVSAAFRRHIDTSALSVVKAGDFKKAGVFE